MRRRPVATVGLPPGRYVLRVDLQSSGIAGSPVWYPMPVTSGGRALVGRPVELEASDVDVTVTFTNRLGRLNVSVRDTSGRETGDARVILFARDPLMRGGGLTGASDCVDRCRGSASFHHHRRNMSPASAGSGERLFRHQRAPRGLRHRGPFAGGAAGASPTPIHSLHPAPSAGTSTTRSSCSSAARSCQPLNVMGWSLKSRKIGRPED